jgi:hypothetical protein
MKSQQSVDRALLPSGGPIRDGDGRMIKDSCNPHMNAEEPPDQVKIMAAPVFAPGCWSGCFNGGGNHAHQLHMFGRVDESL